MIHPHFPRTATGALLVAVLLSAFSCDAATDAAATSFHIRHVSTKLVNEVYHLDARVDYQFGSAVLEALESGVPITVSMDIEVVRPREWLWSETVYQLSQRYRIRYHALTRQYLLTNLNSRVRNSYPTLRAALNIMGSVTGLPILDRRLLKVGEHYQGRLRVRILLDALPSPLRVWAYLSSDWRQESGWYTWPLQ